MSTSPSEQSEDLKGANFELDFGEPSQERLSEPFGTFDEEDPFIIRRKSDTAKYLEPAFSGYLEYVWNVLNPEGLKQIILSCRAVLKAEIEPPRQSVFWCCPKYGLILLLYQKARAPPKSTLLSLTFIHNVMQRSEKERKSRLKSMTSL